ncbi:MAG: hypothetical protein AB1540_05645 [Bdellovibrionota bacterium]
MKSKVFYYLLALGLATAVPVMAQAQEEQLALPDEEAGLEVGETTITYGEESQSPAKKEENPKNPAPVWTKRLLDKSGWGGGVGYSISSEPGAKFNGVEFRGGYRDRFGGSPTNGSKFEAILGLEQEGWVTPGINAEYRLRFLDKGLETSADLVGLFTIGGRGRTNLATKTGVGEVIAAVGPMFCTKDPAKLCVRLLGTAGGRYFREIVGSDDFREKIGSKLEKVDHTLGFGGADLGFGLQLPGLNALGGLIRFVAIDADLKWLYQSNPDKAGAPVKDALTLIGEIEVGIFNFMSLLIQGDYTSTQIRQPDLPEVRNEAGEVVEAARAQSPKNVPNGRFNASMLFRDFVESDIDAMKKKQQRETDEVNEEVAKAVDESGGASYDRD